MRRHSPTPRRPLTVTAALAALLLGVLPAGAAPVRYCEPWPEVATSFCVSYDGLLTTAIAADPLTTTVTVENDSPNVATDKNVWLASAEIALLAGSGGTPRVTPSADLPNGLIVLGGGSCTGPAFTDCGGHGTIRADVSGTGFIDGIRGGTFGIRRLVNVNPPAVGILGDYRADLEFCIDGAPSCQTATAIVQITAGGAGAPAMIIPARYEYEFNTGFGTATIDAAIETASLHIEGTADTVLAEGGEAPADQTYRVFSVPARCGTASSGGTFRSYDTSWVSMTQQVSVTGCPTAAFGAQPDGFAVRLNGGNSAAHVEGRSVSKWLWTFGDGTRQTTTGPLVRHAYTTYGNHTVTLVVEDSAGARSAPVSKLVKGTVIEVNVEKADGRARAYGPLNPDHPGRDVTVTLLRYRDGAYRPVVSRTVELNSSSRYATSFDRRAPGKCQFRVAFAGDADHLGSRDRVNFAC